MRNKKYPIFSWLRMMRSLPLLVLALCILVFLQRKPEAPEKNHANSREQAIVMPRAVAAIDDSMVVNDFREWWSGFLKTPPEDHQKTLEQGREMLVQRRQRMLRLIRENPQQALAESLQFDEYELLPKEWQSMVEKPFSTVTSYDFYPICGAPAGMVPYMAELQIGDLRFEAFTYGRRAGMMSKKQIPVHGVTLDGLAAMADLPLRMLDEDEFTAVRGIFPNGQNDLSRSFLTGKILSSTPTAALGGGKIFYFHSREEIDLLNESLAALDALPGPRAGSDVLFQAKAADGEEQGFAIDAAVESAQMQASAWTENPKNVFLIRADFSDQTGLTFSQANTASVLNGVVSNQIRAMSYGKTWINAGVSANLYRMPQTAAYYVNGGASRNGELLRDARNTFRNSRSGGDATVDVGPVSNNTNGDGGGLGAYDIVGVLFGSINMQSGIVYAGLAGGGNLWMQGNISAGVFTHEFGHNYGIGHASFWQTNDGSVLGNGANDEYGDDYDIMGDGEIPEGHFHAQAKAHLNWLANNQWSDATLGGSNTYRVHRIDSQFTSGTPRGVRITRSAASGNQEYLWLNYRPLYAGVPAFEKGAYIVWQRPGQSRSWLVDTTPTTSGVKSDAPITLGKTFADATSNAFITPLALGGAGDNAWLDVRVNFGPFPGNTAPVAGVISGASSVPARTNQAYSIAANDANGDALAYSWNIGDGSVADNSANISQQWIVGGNYNLNLQVSDMKGGLANASKAVIVTDPLDTWTAGSVGTSDPLENVLYAKGRYVAADYFGGIYLSWDGGTWTKVGSPPDMDQPRLAFGANVFVAAGMKESVPNNAQITWSADGRRWQQATFPNGVPYVRDISFGNGKFVAVGDDGTVLSSADGKSWNVTTVGSMPDFRKVVSSGSVWVGVATSGGNAEHIWTSSDAVTWTQGSSRGFDIYQLVAKNSMIYALGWYGGIEISKDHGVTWADAALPAGTRWTTYLMAIASDGTMLCTARAMDENTSPRALLVSVDGQRWVRANGNAAIAEANGLVWGNGQFLTVDSGGVTQRCQPFFPTNNAPNVAFAAAPSSATARQLVYFAANATDANGDALTYAWDFGAQVEVQDGFEIAPSFTFGGEYQMTLRVSDGRGGLTIVNQVLTVTDPARTFTNRSVASSIGDLQAVAASNSRIVAVGSLFSGSFSGPSLWSTDGTTWNTATAGSNRQLYAITHDGTFFLAAGMRYDFGISGWRSWIATSADGASWTERYYAGTRQLNATVHGNGNYIAAGEGGTVLRSTNGTSWSAVSIPGVSTSVTFEGLAWNGSIFLLTGYTGGNGTTKVYTSTDGLTWTDRSTGAGVASWQDLRKSAWLNDRFVSSGWYSKIRVSTDQGVSFSSTRNDSEETPALAYGGGVYFAAGVNRSASDADVDVLSLDGTNWFSYPAPTSVDRKAAVFFNNRFITVGNMGSIWQSAALTGSNGFGAWQTTNFPSGGLSALADRDPDQDGVKNFLEYALGLSPHTADASVSTPIRHSGRAWLQFSLPAIAQADVRYVVQGNTNLHGNWTSIATKAGTANWVWAAGGTSSISVGSANAGKVPTQVGMPDSVLSQARYFMRLLVEPL